METQIKVHALPVRKLKILLLLLVKQQLFSGLLIDPGKKVKFRGISQIYLNFTVPRLYEISKALFSGNE